MLIGSMEIRGAFVSKGGVLSLSTYYFRVMRCFSPTFSTVEDPNLTPPTYPAFGYGPTWVRPPAVCGAGPGAPSWLGPRLDRTAEVPYVPTL